jgi:hypothetical protein
VSTPNDPAASSPAPGWRAPTRRSFFAMLGAAATALVVRELAAPPAPAPRSTWAGKTRWIGHC